MNEFVTYVLFSFKHNKIYIGYTSSIIQRFYSHNLLANKGFTIKYRPWIVAHVAFFTTKKEAMQNEKWLKSGLGRKYIHDNLLAFYKNQSEGSYPPEADGGSCPPLAT
jgi:putative endonuclease